MQYTFKKKADAQPHPEAERRRVGMIVHDERGNASVDWRDAPADQQRTVLELTGEAGLSLKKEETSFDPYARGGVHRAPTRPASGTATRTDLRKLSEHIKLMRALEERKRNGLDEED